MQVISDDNNQLTHDDMDALQYVLEHVRGSYPDAQYRQIDFQDEQLPGDAY